jgi:hypothetical protein
MSAFKTAIFVSICTVVLCLVPWYYEVRYLLPSRTDTATVPIRSLKKQLFFYETNFCGMDLCIPLTNNLGYLFIEICKELREWILISASRRATVCANIIYWFFFRLVGPLSRRGPLTWTWRSRERRRARLPVWPSILQLSSVSVVCLDQMAIWSGDRVIQLHCR